MSVAPPITLSQRLVMWLLALLRADTTLQSLMAERWYEDQVPAEAVWQSGTTPQPQGLLRVLAGANRYRVGNRRQQLDAIILVRAVVQVPSYTPLLAISDRLLVLLHGAHGPLSSGYLRAATALEEYRQPERSAAGIDYRHLGHRFGFRVQD